RPVARRIARLLGRAARRIAGGKLRFAHRGALPVLRRRRRRVMRVLLPLARIASPEIGEWIALPEQTGKLGQRIAGTCLLAQPRDDMDHWSDRVVTCCRRPYSSRLRYWRRTRSGARWIH